MAKADIEKQISAGLKKAGFTALRVKQDKGFAHIIGLGDGVCRVRVPLDAGKKDVAEAIAAAVEDYNAGLGE